MSDPQAFQQWWLASDKAATVDCRISAQAGWNAALVQSSADIDRLQRELCNEQAKLEAAQKRILEFENLEAACCPEDWSFEEVIASLRRQIADLRGACGSAVLAQHEAVERAERAVKDRNEWYSKWNLNQTERVNLQSEVERLNRENDAMRTEINRLHKELRDPTAKQEANPAFPAESPFPLK